MLKYTTGEARERFSEVVNEAAFGKQRVVLTRHGKEIAALIPISDLQVFHELECLIDVNEAKKALSKLKSEGSITLDELKKELGLK
jgi:prevent-host-death family protein